MDNLYFLVQLSQQEIHGLNSDHFMLKTINFELLQEKKPGW